MAGGNAAIDTKLKVFISYARADLAFADALVAALERHGIDVLIDRRDLPYGEEWKPELLDFVRQSDAVVFVVSAHSVGSRWCKWELEQVTAESKRLIPITLEGVPVENLPPEIGEIHLLPFPQAWDGGRGAGFIAQVEILAKVLLTDHAWVKDHTRLGELARRWQAARVKDGDVRAEALLLRGDALSDAELWISRRPREAPEPTDQHRDYLQESRRAEQARAEREREQLARTRRFQKRSAWALTALAALVLAALAATLWQARETAKREAIVLTSLAHRAIADQRYETAMRTALQGLPMQGGSPLLLGWSTPEMTGLEAKLAGAAQLSPLLRELTGHGGWVMSAAFSPDGARIVTASDDSTARVWDASRGEHAARAQRPHGAVWSAAFSPDGARIVTASEDNTARVWDATSGDDAARAQGP